MTRDVSLPVETSPLIGRRRALSTLADLFSRGERLVTVVGTGGIGKTRLALSYSHRRSQRGERVRFCELAEQRDADGLSSIVARSIGARAVSGDELVQSLRRIDRGLLVLDNFEQLMAQASLLDEWLTECANLRLLVTSREVLRIDREVVLELEPLDLVSPDEEDHPSEALMLWSAARQRLDPSYSTAKDDPAALEDIVRQLDGIPLAIELAAARANLMSTKLLRERLNRRFDVLRERSRTRPERRRTMEGALDWSWELLDAWEQDALAQCSVFNGGFSIDAAEGVLDLSGSGDDAPSVLDVLQALRDKSLVRQLDAGRLTMFATIRDYGARRLSESDGNAQVVEQRHATYFGELAQRLVRASLGADGADALDDLGADLDNFLAVAERVTGAETPDIDSVNCALDSIVAADKVFGTRGPHDGHREPLDHVIAAADGVSADPVRLSRALRARGLMTARRGFVDHGRADIERAVELAKASPGDLGRALLDLSWTYLRQRDLDRVVALCEEALAVARGSGVRWLEGMALGALGAPSKERGDDGEAARLYQEALAIHRETDNRWYEGLAHTRLAVLRLEHGDLARAQEHAEQALTVHREFGIRAAEAIMLQCLGGVSHVGGQLEEARDCYAESSRVAEAIGDSRLLGTALGYRAIAELELGDLEAARDHLDVACRTSRAVGEHRHAALFYGYRGAVEALFGESDDARRQLELAREILGEHSDLKMEASVAVLSALIEVTQSAQGQAGARERAEAAIQKALEPRGTLENPETSSADIRIALRIVRHAIAALDAADTSDDAIRVDPSGAWFHPPGGERVDCRRRQALRRILVRLARQRVQQPGTPIPPEGLIAAGWPDERMSSASAQNRLYVTINRLRQLGLHDNLQLVEGGYRLNPDVPLALVPQSS